MYTYVLNDSIAGVDPRGLAMVPNFGPARDAALGNAGAKYLGPPTAGAMLGVATAGAIVYGAVPLALAAGVSKSVIAGTLFTTGAVGGGTAIYSMVSNPSYENISFNVGALAGGLGVGASAANSLAADLSPPNYQPNSGGSFWGNLMGNLWRDQNGTPNPFAFIGDWILGNPLGVNPMATGPDITGATGVVGGTAAGLDALTKILLGCP